MNHSPQQATFFLNRAKIASFHLKISILYNEGQIDDLTKDELISLFCDKYSLSVDEYHSYIS